MPVKLEGRIECAKDKRNLTLIGQTAHCSYKENKEMTALELCV